MYEDEFELTFQVPEEEPAPEPPAVPAAKAADCTGDGVVNGMDLARLRQLLTA